MFPLRISFTNVRNLLTRFGLEYKELWRVQIFRDLLDRLLYLMAFGFGMGATIKTMAGMPYLNFLVPGIAASTGVFIMTMAMTFGVRERISSYRLYSAWLATPVRLPEILIAELLYAALRAMPSILILYLLAGLLGGISSWVGAALSIPLIFLANLMFGAVGLCFTSHIVRHLHFAYVNTLWTTPMFLFSGVFFDLSHTSPGFWWFCQLLPLTHVLELVRPLVTGQPIGAVQMVASLLVIVGVLVGAYLYALWRFSKRLLD